MVPSAVQVPPKKSSFFTSGPGFGGDCARADPASRMARRTVLRFMTAPWMEVLSSEGIAGGSD
jgi:hypothetical protein